MLVFVLILAALPFAVACVNLRLYLSPKPATGTPAMSVLIPARNEAGNIGKAVAAVLACTGVELELIVLDDGSTDATPAILAAIADPRLRVAAAPPLPAGWCGKQHACAVLGAMAGHDLLVFVDADVRLAPDALSRMAGFMQRSPAALASGFPRQITVTPLERLLLPLIHFLLLGFLPIWMMRRSRSPGLGAGCGQLMVAQADAYRRMGGHAAIRASLHDGLTLPRAFRRAGFATDLFDASPFATCRMYANAAEVWQGLSKNATEGMATARALPLWAAILGIGQVAPAILLVANPGWIVAAALGCGIGVRLILAIRFRQPIDSALLHPLGVATLLALQARALLRAAIGRPASWRGRSYIAP